MKNQHPMNNTLSQLEETIDIQFKDKFLELGIIEKIGRTNGMSYMLSHAYYAHQGKTGVYTKIVGISRDEKKELILKHLQKNSKGYIAKGCLRTRADLMCLFSQYFGNELNPSLAITPNWALLQ